MFSRFMLVALSVGALFGCSLKTGDSLPTKPPMVMKMPAMQCVDPSVSILKTYFQGTATADQVSGAWDCFDTAIKKFQVETRGANRDRYTADELRTFFQIYYLNGKKISDPFLSDLFKIKQLLVGGDNISLTKGEIKNLRASLMLLKAESLRLRPYIGYYLETIAPEQARLQPADTESAIDAAVESSRQLSLIFSHASIVYTQDDMKSLLHELAAFVGNWNAPDQAIQFMPALAAVKEFLVGGKGEEISGAEFLPFFDRAGRLASLHLRANYFLKGADSTNGEGLKQTELMLKGLVQLLRDIAQSQPSQVILFERSERLIDEIARLDFLPKDFPAEGAKKAFRLVVEKLLVPPPLSVSRVNGFGLQAIDSLNSYGTLFIERQKAWERLQTLAQTQGLVANGDAIRVDDVKRLWPAASQGRFLSSDNLPNFLSRNFTPTYLPGGVIDFSVNHERVITSSGFVRMNSISMVGTILNSGYGKTSPTSLTQKEFGTFFDDFFEVARELKFLGPKDKKLGQSSFDEANIFTFDARNDKILSQFELYDYIAEISGASTIADQAQDELAKSCRSTGSDDLKHPMYSGSCFRSTGAKNFDTYFEALPEWTKISRRQADAGNWLEFEDALERASRDGVSGASSIQETDITRMTMVMQYIETLFVRFDRDRSGTLDYDEAVRALPLFDPMLRQASGFKSDKKVLALFMYILNKGRAPTSVGDKLDFVLSWSRNPSKWTDLHADRLRLLNVVAAMSKPKK